MKYIGENRVYIDTISGIGIELKYDMKYPAALIRDESKEFISLGCNAEIFIEYPLGGAELEWDV